MTYCCYCCCIDKYKYKQKQRSRNRSDKVNICISDEFSKLFFLEVLYENVILFSTYKEHDCWDILNKQNINLKFKSYKLI